ncbi:MAG: SNF2-related protein [archaeon]|nr:SNF2-related protein [archaeon]
MLKDIFIEALNNVNQKSFEDFFTYFEYKYSFNFDENYERPYLLLELYLKESDLKLVYFTIDSSGLVDFDCNICEINEYYHEDYCPHVSMMLAKFYLDHKDEIILKLNEFEDFETNRQIIVDQKEFDKEINNVLDSKKLINQIDKSNKVNIQVHFETFYNNDFVIELYVGYAKKYKIKDFNKFLRLVLNNEYFKYGKELAFIHNIEVFDEYSKNIILYLLHDVARRELISPHNYINKQIDDFLNISKGNYVYIDECRYYVQNEPIELKFIINDDFKILTSLDEKRIKFFGNDFIRDDENLTITPLSNHKEISDLFHLLKAHPHSNIRKQIVSFKNIYINKFPEHFIINEDVNKLIKESTLSIDSYFDYVDKKITCNNKLLRNSEEVDPTSITDEFENQIIRDYYSLLESYDFKNLTIDENGDIFKFLNSSLTDFKSFGKVYLSENLVNKKVSIFSPPSIRVQLKGSILDVTLETSKFSEEELLSIYNAIKRKKKYILIGENFIDLNNESAQDFALELENYKLIENKKVIHTAKAPLYCAFKSLEGNNKVNIDKYLEDAFEEIKHFDKASIETNLINGELRPYQEDGIKWLKTLYKYGLGGILADDMGLGKTIEIIGFLNEIKPNGPVLIVCPKSLVFNWMNEFNKFSNKTKVIPISGLSKEREKSIKKITGKCVVLISYDTLRNDIDKFCSIDFDCVILDEAQYIKNAFAKKTNAVKKIKSKHQFALTGTPIENNIYDLWSIFDFLMPEYLQSLADFKSSYESNEEYVKKVKVLISPFVLRRRKKDVLKQLPEKYEVYITCEMLEEQRKLYDSYRVELKRKLNQADTKDTIQILSFLTRMRQLCVDPSLFIENYTGGSGKINTLVDIINKKTSENHRILVFSQFVSALEIVKKKLKSNGILYEVITGETSAKERVNICEKFNNDETIKVVLISLKAGGTGLNLIGADTVIHLDPWWNLAAENQASDRAHRIGQIHNVEVIKLVAENSIEQRVINIQNEKKELVDILISNNDQSIKKITLSEIKKLLI